MSRVSIVVPVLNEEARIGPLLDALGRLGGIHDIVAADGGSTDRTIAMAEAAGVGRVVRAPRGRACQMNTGARAAAGDVFWFVHADAVVTPEAVAAIADPAVQAGAFRIRTVGDDPVHWAARWLWLADLRSRYTHQPYGDQAMFVRRDVFDRVGGFPEQPLFEDLEFCRRLRRAGIHVHTLPLAIDVSGRRFLARPIYYAMLMNVLPVLYRLGVPPPVLARTYGSVR
jgi:rSAM/selenodomain-associated transferase 2